MSLSNVGLGERDTSATFSGTADFGTIEPSSFVTAAEFTGRLHMSGGNRPAKHLWEVTSCKADMNNDGSVNGGDIDAFTTALSDPAEHEEDFPGLDGCIVWHGDMNCDGSLNGNDITPFVEFMQSEPCCVSNCYGCDPPRGEGAGGEVSAEDLAAAFADNTTAEHLSAFIGYVADFAAALEGDAAEYWEDVVAYLSQ